MSMTVRQKRIALAIVVSGAAIGFWYYTKKRNEAEAVELMKIVDASGTQNDLAKAGDETVSKIENLPLTINNLQIDNVNSTKELEKFKKVAIEVTQNLNKSISGLGTNTDLFFKNFFRIKNKEAMKFVNTFYKVLYGETLFNAIQGEDALYLGKFSRTILDPFDMNKEVLPNYNVNIVKWLNMLNAKK